MEEEEIQRRVCHIEYFHKLGEDKTVEDFMEEVVDLFRIHDMEICFMGDGPVEDDDGDDDEW